MQTSHAEDHAKREEFGKLHAILAANRDSDTVQLAQLAERSAASVLRSSDPSKISKIALPIFEEVSEISKTTLRLGAEVGTAIRHPSASITMTVSW